MPKGSFNNVLIIDDEVGPRESLKIILNGEYNLNFADCGREGLRKVTEVKVQVAHRRLNLYR